MIKINEVNKYYNKGNQNEIHVIDNVTLELPEKGMIALFGKSGCGKTTLLNVIGGLDKYENGNVLIDGNDIKDDTDFIRNKYIGYIFQNYNLNNNVSCYDNVLDALKLSGVRDLKAADEIVMKTLKNVGIEKFKKRLPNTLSGGQQQRIAIARALVKNPKIILADEPTGNLDENNTIMIMNLLKTISVNHLVLLVTHEENLVQKYCDMIVNLSDGKIIDIKENSSDDSLESKNKNDIYLGEFNKKDSVSDNSIIEYYGEDLKEKIKIILVNDNGNVYLKVDSNNVKIINNSNEIKLKDGKFVHKKIKESIERFEITNIEDYQTNQFGKLFSLKDSIKSGFISNFMGKRKKKDKALHRLLMLFSIVIVFMTAIFGTSFSQLEKIDKSYNHNLFYINLNSKTNEDIIRNNINNDESYIDYYQMKYDSNITEEEYIDFTLAGFETATSGYRNSLTTKGVILSNQLINDSKVIAGSIDYSKDYQIQISKILADDLIENSKFGYIKNYDDLIGIYCENIVINKRVGVIGAVVDTDDKAVYVNQTYLAQKTISSADLNFRLVDSFGLSVLDGEAIYLEYDKNISYKIGDKITIHGNDLKITKIIKFMSNYTEWLKFYYPSFYMSEEDYFINIINNSTDLTNYDEVKNIYYFDYIDYIYQKFDEFINDYKLFDSTNINLYLYYEKDIELAKYNFMDNGLMYYWAKQYKNSNNRFPYFNEIKNSEVKLLKETMTDYISQYQDFFYDEYYNPVYSNTYLISANDLINISKISGKNYNIEEPKHVFYSKYLTIHSINPEKTYEWLQTLNLVSDENDNSAYITPYDMKNELLENVLFDIIQDLISLVVILVIMCICMVFIMKSSVMNRIKEIGIYRAIGVSKKNLMFKYFIEITILTTFTVFIGYILGSIFIGFAATLSNQIISVFYYPWYLALFVAVLLYFISIISGLIPIKLLLKKTPSEILSKYDI